MREVMRGKQQRNGNGRALYLFKLPTDDSPHEEFFFHPYRHSRDEAPHASWRPQMIGLEQSFKLQERFIIEGDGA